MLTHIIIFVILLAFAMFYLKHPHSLLQNFHNTSNTSKTITGAGIIFIPALLLYILFFQKQISHTLYYFILSIFILSIISFIDDLKPLSPIKRILFQCIAVTVVLFGYDYFNNISWTVTIVLMGTYLLIIGYTNIYNFMDGINGMAVLNALCSYFTFYFINTYLLDFIDHNLLITFISVTIILTYFNFRKNPKCYIGDVGSITMGFTIIFFTLKLYVTSKNPIVFLILTIYVIDSGWTILERIYRKENILKPHLRHLYELYVYKLKIPHLNISVVYMSLQFIINSFVYYALKKNWVSIIPLVILFVCLSLIYYFIKRTVYKSIKR